MSVGDYTLSDVAAVTGNRCNDGYGFNNMNILWFALLFSRGFGFGGGYGFNPNGEPVTQAGLCDAMNFNNVENAIGRMSDQNVQQTSQIANGISQLGYELQGQLGTISKDMALGNANLAQQMASCCCGIERNLDAVNYNNAMNTASINSTTTAQTQRILDKMCQMENENLRSALYDMKLDQKLGNVVRYPNGFVYTAGTNPFCSGTVCCGNGNI